MASSANRFSRLEKIAIFLLVLGEKRAREVLRDLDVDTLDQISAAILELGEVTPAERAAVMVEFGDLFCHGKPLGARLQDEPEPPAAPPPGAQAAPSATEPGRPSPPPAPERPRPVPGREAAARSALEHLRQRVDPSQIDWSRAGYDFGEGFKGPAGDRR
ncbi:MAG: hypothetical protein AB1505_28110 [Candidatus Latescibacterota bacterium]